MGKYGEVSYLAVQAIMKNGKLRPRQAWAEAAEKIFGEGNTSARKGCPRSAFLGLCEAGMVRGVPKGKYTRATKNKEYALKAAVLLKTDPSFARNAGELWRRITSNKVNHNSQMDVVITLWNKDLLL